MTYEIAQEDGVAAHGELLPLYREHYAEMQARLAGDGVKIEPFAPQTEVYFDYMRRGFLRTYVLREGGAAIGYCNIYLVKDMHNGAPIAQEDAIFVTRAHRNGVGKRLVRYILGDLKAAGVKRVNVTAMTDLRVAKIWERMGFKPVATAMTYSFEDN